MLEMAIVFLNERNFWEGKTFFLWTMASFRKKWTMDERSGSFREIKKLFKNDRIKTNDLKLFVRTWKKTIFYWTKDFWNKLFINDRFLMNDTYRWNKVLTVQYNCIFARGEIIEIRPNFIGHFGHFYFKTLTRLTWLGVGRKKGLIASFKYLCI